MASFVEQATLLLDDSRATANIDRVNNALKRLFNTARQMRNMRIDLRINSGAEQRIQSLARAARDLTSATAGVRTLRVNVVGSPQVRQVMQLLNSIPRNRNATFNLGVSNLAQVRQAVTALRELQRLQGRRTAGAVPLVGARQLQTLQAITREARDTAAAVALIGQGGPSAGLRAIHSMIREMLADARGVQQAMSGFGRNAVRRPAAPDANPITPALDRVNWRGYGSQIGFGFRAAIGAEFFNILRTAGRSAGEGILTADDAKAIARASGVNVDRLVASATRATAGTTGVSTGDIVAAASEQTAQLEGLLRTRQITEQEFTKRLDQMTTRIASNASILTTFTHDAGRAAEQARQLEKVLAITGSQMDPQEAAKMNRAALQAIIASGGDVGPEEVKRLLQQLGGTVRQALSERGLINAILLRDEGGRMSTAEIRTAMQDLFRGNLNKADREAQVAAGLRTETGETKFLEKEFGDPIGFAVDEIIPRLKKLGVSLDDSIAINNALDTQLGFTTTGARLFASVIPQIQQVMADLERARNIRPEALLERPTLRNTLADVEAKFQDAAVAATERLLPSVQTATAGLADTFERLSRGEMPTAAQLGGLAATAVGVSAISLLDPATRPLAAAGLSLTGAAAALTASAAALTGAAGANALFSRAGAGAFLSRLGFIGSIFGGSIAAINSVRGTPRGEPTAPRGTVAEKLNELNPALFESATERGVRAGLQSLQQVQEDRLTRVRPAEEAAAIQQAAQQKVQIDQATLEVGRMMALERQDAALRTGEPAADARRQAAFEVNQGATNTVQTMLTGMDTAATTIQTAFGVGNQQFTAAGQQTATTIGTSLTTGGQSAGASIASQMIAAAQSAGAAIAAAIANASSQVRIQVQNVGPTNGPAAPANTGATGGGL